MNVDCVQWACEISAKACRNRRGRVARCSRMGVGSEVVLDSGGRKRFEYVFLSASSHNTRA